MIYEVEGQSVDFLPKTYSVGGRIWIAGKKNGADFAVIQKIYTDQHSVAGPMALCDFGDDRTEMLLLELLEPVASHMPKAVGKQYVLHYFCDGGDGQQSKVLGISEDRSVLLALMLENVKEDAQVELSGAFVDEEQDSFHFIYESQDLADNLYLEYEIAPVPIFKGLEGGAAA